MPNQIQLKDAEQDKKIALLEHRIEENEKLAEELRIRIRKNEKWIAGAAAVISAAVTIIGIAVAVESKEMDYGYYDTSKSEELLQFPRS